MERLELKREEAIKTLAALNRAIPQPYTEYMQDSVIKRFEFSFEAFWKYLKEYLLVQFGKTAAAPKTCFREALTVELISEDECHLFLEMTDNRNLTTHTYDEFTAMDLYKKVPGYAEAIGKVVERVEVG